MYRKLLSLAVLSSLISSCHSSMSHIDNNIQQTIVSTIPQKISPMNINPQLNHSWINELLITENPVLSLSYDPYPYRYQISSGSNYIKDALIQEEKLVVLFRNGTVIKYKQSDPQVILWTTSVEDTDIKSSSVNFYNNKIVVSHNRSISLIDSRTGKKKWSRTLHATVQGKTAVTEDRIFISTIDHHIYALDIKNGSILWYITGNESHITKYNHLSSPILIKTEQHHVPSLIIQDSVGTAQILDTENGEPIFYIAAPVTARTGVLNSWISTPIYIAKSNVLLMSYHNGKTLAVDMQTQKILWEKELSIDSQPSILGQNLIFITSNNILTHLSLEDINNPQILSELPLQSEETYYQPIIANDNVYINSYNNKHIFTCNVYDFSSCLSYTSILPELPISPPMIANQVMYVLTKNYAVLLK